MVWDDPLGSIDCREDCSYECGSCSCDNRDCVVGDSAFEGSKATRISERVCPCGRSAHLQSHMR